MEKILSILILILPLVTFSQNNEQPSIIFEGVAVAAIEFFIDDMGKADTNTTGEHGLKSVYTTNTSYLVKVTRVLKGHEYLDTGYVEVITKLSYNHLNNHGKYENYIPNLYPGIFFMELNTVSATLERKTNNTNVLQPFNFKPMKIDFNRRDLYAYQQWSNQQFKTEEDLAIFLKDEYNIEYLNKAEYYKPENDEIKEEEFQPKKKSVFLNDGSVKQSNDCQENLINYNQFILNSKIKQEKQSNFTTKSNHTLELELDNVTMTGDANFRYYEFDILASDVDGGYFDNLLIRLTYNTNAFGSNLVANENIIVNNLTKGVFKEYNEINDIAKNIDKVITLALSIAIYTNEMGGENYTDKTPPTPLDWTHWCINPRKSYCSREHVMGVISDFCGGAPSWVGDTDFGCIWGDFGCVGVTDFHC